MYRPLACLIPLISGCYAYAPIESTSAPPGIDVRARMSVSAAERISPLVGGADARLLSGTLIANANGVLVVEVPLVVRAGVGSTFETLNQRVSIPRGDLLELETRRLDRFRTGTIAGAAAVIVGTIVFRALQGQPGKEATPGGGSSDSRSPR